ncbi:MAG: hypothetical protein SFU98_10015 [Leptospiraceae bacterium]|nr:hypothetical protein [Leptospiraceae bacterium]
MLAISSPLTILVDVFLLVGLSLFFGWYFYFYLKREIIGGYLGAILFALVGSLLFFTFSHKIIRDILMWFMSPKIGSYQISNLNLIVVALGAFGTLYLVDKIQNRKRKID